MNWIDRIYIISLKSHQTRRDTIIRDLDSAGFDTRKVQFIDGVDGSQLDVNQCIKDGIISDTFLDPYGLLTKSIYGCAFSHQLAYEMFLNTKSENALILEDDASLTHTLLRMLLPNSKGYTKLVDEVGSIDWEVIVMGGQNKRMEFEESDSLVLKKMKKYPINYAGHSYLVNRIGAQKLLDNNKCVKFAADVNIHMSGVNLYCTPISYFVQKMGNMEKELILKLINDFQNTVVYNQNGWDVSEIVSGTLYGDGNITKNITKMKSINISDDISLYNVDWEPFEWEGDVVEGWASIHLKS